MVGSGPQQDLLLWTLRRRRAAEGSPAGLFGPLPGGGARRRDLLRASLGAWLYRRDRAVLGP